METVTTKIRIGEVEITVTAPCITTPELMADFGRALAEKQGPFMTPKDTMVKFNEIYKEEIAELKPSHKLVCKRCGKKFTSVHGTRLYCYNKACLKTATKEAAKLTNKKPIRVYEGRVCTVCGEKYSPTGNRQKMCANCREMLAKEPKPKYNKMPVAELGDIDTKAPVVVEPVVSEFVMPDDWKRCVSCGRKFKSYEGDNDLCNPNCVPLSVEQKTQMDRVLREGDMMNPVTHNKGGKRGN